ncbi:MAG: sugar phosphate isomerase/epimerase, partial [Planctomycetaceae bacterium]|nr:sugar phosphate isomerase/epimerase [Planctomycetaceae bacterium]
VEAGKERFVDKTAKLRAHANSLGIYLAHEIHPGTAAMCADEFNMLVDICDGDQCLAVNADPSHCWEGEDWESRFLKVGPRVYGCHVKNFTIHKGVPLRKMESDWHNRAMQFTDLATGDLNMTRYAEVMLRIGYAKRYCEVMGTETAPLVVEAESNYRDGDATSADGIAWVRDNLCFPVAEGSFEDAMGA